MAVNILKMAKNEDKQLSKNELKIIELTIEGESQRSIAAQVGVSPAIVCRTLKKEHIREQIRSATQELHFPVYRKMMDNYARGLERIGREIDTMELKELNKYLGHMRPLISGVITETIREELKKQSEAEKAPVKFQIKYSDTDQTIRREALKLLKEWGYGEPPEDIKK